MNKNRFGLLLPGLLGLIVACGLLILSNQLSALAQSPQAESTVIPLEGLDPILLTQGKEVIGRNEFSVTRGRFQYLFANAENKAAFERDPQRYEIQLGATCARMGLQVGGNPDLFSVYKERIYVFGSNGCKQLFDGAPEKYLLPASPAIAATPEALKKGQEWIDKAVAALGGAARIDALTSYQETGLAVIVTQQGAREVKTTFVKMFPDFIRREQVRPFGTRIEVLSPAVSFSHFYTASQSGTQVMAALQRADIEKQFARNGLDILRARQRSDFKAIATGSSKIGETAVEQVAVSFANVTVRISIAPSGQILNLAYTDRGGNGEFGDIVLMFSDFRSVDGITLPFKTTGTFNGQADPQLSYTVESITLNGKVDPTFFAVPQKAQK